mmetsp:Transcript_51110/g.150711  ORF Transcript_51110/g.150711 Transcript_51110/m.150711 type:complete len:309 (+) Transcript_51110:538-1464(+)
MGDRNVAWEPVVATPSRNVSPKGRSASARASRPRSSPPRSRRSSRSRRHRQIAAISCCCSLEPASDRSSGSSAPRGQRLVGVSRPDSEKFIAPSLSPSRSSWRLASCFRSAVLLCKAASAMASVPIASPLSFPQSSSLTLSAYHACSCPISFAEGQERMRSAAYGSPLAQGSARLLGPGFVVGLPPPCGAFAPWRAARGPGPLGPGAPFAAALVAVRRGAGAALAPTSEPRRGLGAPRSAPAAARSILWDWLVSEARRSIVDSWGCLSWSSGLGEGGGDFGDQVMPLGGVGGDEGDGEHIGLPPRGLP